MKPLRRKTSAPCTGSCSGPATVSDSARTIGFVVAVVAGGLLVARRELVSRWVYLAIAAGLGGWLTAVSNLHGPALLAGLALGAVITGAVAVEPEPRAGARKVVQRRP